MAALADLFSAEGALSQSLPHYQLRKGQLEMATRVEQALDEGGQYALEAGTGVGKTFAYLVPIMLSGKSALISTGSRALQDQLSQRDVPTVARALGVKVSLAVLKGRANYICKQALADGGSRGGELSDDSDGGHWQKILDFSASSQDGDINGIRDVPANSPLLQQALSTPESCNTQRCAHYKECFLYKARARAQQADIVIVNHHLFLSDLRLRDDGVAELLPTRDVVLFDEAHRLPELAPEFFGEQLASSQLLKRLALLEKIAGELEMDSQPLTAAVSAVREGLGKWLNESENVLTEERKTPPALSGSDWGMMAMDLQRRLASLTNLLIERVGEDERLGKMAQRLLVDQKMLKLWLEDMEGQPAAEDDNDAAGDDEVAAADEEPLVRWVEYHAGNRHLTLQAVPMTGRDFFARQWQELPTVIFTSATLSIDGVFHDFCEAAGLKAAQTQHWVSPYDFANRSLLYIPRGLPQPNDYPDHPAAVAAAVLPLIRANAGRAFLLFSSWRALNSACETLQPQLAAENISILKQGDMPNDKLLDCFRRQSRVVLIGSRLFWEGVDVRGNALSLLMVDKIPFVPPTDPLLAARDEWRKKQGENPFLRNQLPAAVLSMRQAAGRLIRDYEDHGVFVIADPRIIDKRYGKTILKALPPMPQCRDEKQAVKFLQSFGAGAD